jgi:hypothetical protein
MNIDRITSYSSINCNKITLRSADKSTSLRFIIDISNTKEYKRFLSVTQDTANDYEPNLRILIRTGSLRYHYVHRLI